MTLTNLQTHEMYQKNVYYIFKKTKKKEKKTEEEKAIFFFTFGIQM